MMYDFDWGAEIKPGVGMLGLPLGLTYDAVTKLIAAKVEGKTGIAVFKNSPRLLVDSSQEGAIFLRGADVKERTYDWHGLLARLIFDQEILTQIIVQYFKGEDKYRYSGKLFGDIGLGSKVVELMEFHKFDFDDGDEVFYSNEVAGLEVGSENSCSLEEIPGQNIVYIKVFKPMFQ